MKRMKCKGDALTADEVSILQGIARSGARYCDIGRELGISSTAVGNALYRISHKINVWRRHNLAIYAYQHGLVDPLSITIGEADR
jgi:DNA-binding NarL/FixJ family response regulator